MFYIVHYAVLFQNQGLYYNLILQALELPPGWEELTWIHVNIGSSKNILILIVRLHLIQLKRENSCRFPVTLLYFLRNPNELQETFVHQFNGASTVDEKEKYEEQARKHIERLKVSWIFIISVRMEKMQLSIGHVLNQGCIAQPCHATLCFFSVFFVVDKIEKGLHDSVMHNPLELHIS